VLLEAVRNNRTDLKDIYNEGEKAEAEFLINKLHSINQRIESQPGGSQTKSELQNELNGVRSELVLFQERLAAAHPELVRRTGPARLLTQVSRTISQVQMASPTWNMSSRGKMSESSF
jgi:hypothetical protein